MDKKLFKTVFRVHFKPGHPKVDEWEFGKLTVMLYAETAKEAAELAIKVVFPIPYFSLGACKASPVDDENLIDLEISCFCQAALVGVGFALQYWPKGTNENEVLGDWPGLIPLIDVP